MPEGRVPALLLTGTIGAGKTALAAEIGDVLEERGVAAAVIDLDWLGWTTFGSHRALMRENLAAIWPNFSAAGARYAVMARLIESADELAELRAAAPELDIIVVRIDAPRDVIRTRLERRDTGSIAEEHLRQSEGFAETLGSLAIEDLVVTNDERPIRELAFEVLHGVGWI